MTTKKFTKQLFVLLFALVVVLAMLFYLLSIKSGPGVQQGQLRSSLPYVDGRHYYNPIFHYTVSAADADWQVTAAEVADSLHMENARLTVFENINPQVQLRRNDRDTTIALVELGVIRLVAPRNALSLAERSLQEILVAYSNKTDSIRVLAKPTLSTGTRLAGAYFVVQLPPGLAMPVWVVTFIVRDDLAFAIISQSRLREYDLLRRDITAIIESFRFI